MRTPDLPWSIPLSVRFSSGVSHLFSGPYDALDFLENEWPTRNGQKFIQAVRLCRSALNRGTPLAIARKAFIAACLEVGIQVTEAAPLKVAHAPRERSSTW
jgi:hypothetical protein